LVLLFYFGFISTVLQAHMSQTSALDGVWHSAWSTCLRPKNVVNHRVTMAH